MPNGRRSRCRWIRNTLTHAVFLVMLASVLLAAAAFGGGAFPQ